MEVTLIIPDWVVVIATIIIALWLLNLISTTVLYVMELRLARERRKGKYLRYCGSQIAGEKVCTKQCGYCKALQAKIEEVNQIKSP